MFTLLAGVSLAFLSAVSIGMFVGESPSLVAPSSMVIMIPAFLSWPWYVVFGLPVFTFWLWAYQLYFGVVAIPTRSLMLFVFEFLASMVWFILGWRNGIEFQGRSFTLGTLLLSLLVASTLSVVTVSAWRRPTWAKSLASHWLAWAWLVTYAFPYLAESP